MHIEPFVMTVEGTKVSVRQRGLNNTYDIDTWDDELRSRHGFTVAYNLPDRPKTLKELRDMVAENISEKQRSESASEL